MYKFSRTTNAFYNDQIHETIPSDAVKITDDYYHELMTAMNSGMVINSDDKGFPRLEIAPIPSIEQLKNQCKVTARQLLVDSDWSQHADVTAVLTNKAEFDAYRATVRDLFLRPVPEPVFPEEPDAIWGAQ